MSIVRERTGDGLSLMFDAKFDNLPNKFPVKIKLVVALFL